MKQVGAFSLASMTLWIGSAAAAPLHLEYNFEEGSIRFAYLRANEIANGSFLDYSDFTTLQSTNWSASASVDIGDDYSAVTFRSFRYSRADLVGSVSDSFDLAFFGSSPYEVQLSSFIFEIVNKTFPLGLDGSFCCYAPISAFSFTGDRIFLGEPQPFSITGESSTVNFGGTFRPNSDLTQVELTAIGYFRVPQTEPIGAGAFGPVDLELSADVSAYFDLIGTAAPTSVPEPCTLPMMGTALAGLGLWGRVQRSRLR